MTLNPPTVVLFDARTPNQVPRPVLEELLTHKGVVGLSVAQMWDTVEPEPGVYDFSTQKAVLDLCRALGKSFAARFRAGVHTPTFNRGRTWVPERGLAAGLTLPCPFNTDGTANSVFLSAYRKLVWEQRRALAPSLVAGDILHFSQFGGNSAELFAPTDPKTDDSITRQAGYSQQAVVDAHLQLVQTAQNAQGAKPWSIEFPLGGFAPFSLPSAISAKLATKPRSFVQLNWLYDEMPVPNTITSWRYGTNPPHGLQMIHDGNYDWQLVYHNARLSGASYVEVYLNSFKDTGRAALLAEAAR